MSLRNIVTFNYAHFVWAKLVRSIKCQSRRSSNKSTNKVLQCGWDKITLCNQNKSIADKATGNFSCCNTQKLVISFNENNHSSMEMQCTLLRMSDTTETVLPGAIVIIENGRPIEFGSWRVRNPPRRFRNNRNDRYTWIALLLCGLWIGIFLARSIRSTKCTSNLFANNNDSQRSNLTCELRCSIFSYHRFVSAAGATLLFTINDALGKLNELNGTLMNSTLFLISRLTKKKVDLEKWRKKSRHRSSYSLRCSIFLSFPKFDASRFFEKLGNLVKTLLKCAQNAHKMRLKCTQNTLKMHLKLPSCKFIWMHLFIWNLTDDMHKTKKNRTKTEVLIDQNSWAQSQCVWHTVALQLLQW